MTFARSVNPIVIAEHSITRMAVTTLAEAEKQNGDNRTMGRKYTIPYGLYLSKGYVSAHLAAQTGFGQEDMDLFWEALKNMFDLDHSASKGSMNARKLIVFKHNTALGNAPAHKLFDSIRIELINKLKPARSFDDYKITIDREKLPPNIDIIDMI